MNSSFISLLSKYSICLCIVFSTSFCWPAEGIHLGISKTIVSGLNGADAKITMEQIFRQTILSEMGVNVKIFETREEFFNGIRNREIGVFALRSIDYISLKAEGVPIRGNNLTITSGDTPLIQYVLLCKKQKEPKTLEDFKGAHLIMGQGEATRLDHMWLNLVLARAGLPTTDEFFGVKQTEVQTSKALVPVFFGKADLCLVRRHSWEVMCELNPQMGRFLEVVEESPEFAESIVASSPLELTDSQSATFTKDLHNMHLSKSGAALLTITRVKRFTAFNESWLENVKQVVAEHEKVFGKELLSEMEEEK